MPTIVVAPIDFLADAPDAEFHAFPRRDGFPSGSLCGQVRWTVRQRPHGAGFCRDCVGVMREQQAWLTEALAVVDGLVPA
jgi:hypothetical protein